MKGVFRLIPRGRDERDVPSKYGVLLFSGNRIRRAVDGFGGGEEPTTVAFMDPSRVAN